jgi:hypothetical protein
VPALAVLFVALGVWVAAAPGSVPGLTQPDSAAAEQARMRMMHEPAAPMTEQPAAPMEKRPPAMSMTNGR